MAKDKNIQHKTDWKKLLGYKWILNNIPFFVFLAVLAVAYIANGHRADKTIRQVNETQKEIQRLEFEYKTAKSDVMKVSREASIVDAASKLSLKIDTVPPVRLTMENN